MISSTVPSEISLRTVTSLHWPIRYALRRDTDGSHTGRHGMQHVQTNNKLPPVFSLLTTVLFWDWMDCLMNYYALCFWDLSNLTLQRWTPLYVIEKELSLTVRGFIIRVMGKITGHGEELLDSGNQGTMTWHDCTEELFEPAISIWATSESRTVSVSFMTLRSHLEHFGQRLDTIKTKQNCHKHPFYLYTRAFTVITKIQQGEVCKNKFSAHWSLPHFSSVGGSLLWNLSWNVYVNRLKGGRRTYQIRDLPNSQYSKQLYLLVIFLLLE